MTRVTRPASFASSAESGTPVRFISTTRRPSIRIGPTIGEMQHSAPTLPPEKANFDRDEAITMSDASTISAPAPYAGPSTTAIRGLSQPSSSRQNGRTSLYTKLLASVLDEKPWTCLMSRPAENEPPAPVIMTNRTFLLCSALPNDLARSLNICLDNALRTSGLFIVIQAAVPFSWYVRSL